MGNMRPKRVGGFLAAAIALLPSASYCITPEDPAAVSAAIIQAANRITTPGARVTVGTLAGARFMASCPTPLNVQISGTAPYEQAAVRCSDPNWLLYVQVTVNQVERVEVAAHTIAAETTLTASDMQLETEPVSHVAGRETFNNPSSLVGAVTTMSLMAGQPFSNDSVQQPVIVSAGQTTSVSVVSGGATISIMAQADETGHLGDTILMTNPSTGRRFSARVTADGPVIKIED